jgi:hypothetical protein
LTAPHVTERCYFLAVHRLANDGVGFLRHRPIRRDVIGLLEIARVSEWG